MTLEPEPLSTFNSAPLAPGASLGLLGGGQLGQMFTQAAIGMGYKVVCLTPLATPIGRLAKVIQAPFTDESALQSLIDQTSGVTLEFENVPLAAAEYIQSKTFLRPGVQALKTAQDRLIEKAFLLDKGCQVAPFWPVTNPHEYQTALAQGHFPAVLKTARDGYDGKGQVKVMLAEELARAWQSLGQVPCILEAFIDFSQEISMLVARDVYGQTVVYPPAVNTHKDHILYQSWVGLALPQWVLTAATDAAQAIADGLDYQGCLCIEFFQCADQLLVNEIAPRPHNSGHSTLESFSVSQYEQQLRALVGLPVVKPSLRCPSVLLNLLGQSPLFSAPKAEAEGLLQQLLSLEGVHFHSYGKAHAEVGRKMGHLVIEGADLSLVTSRLELVESLLGESLLG